MSSVVIFCKRCWCGYASCGEIPACCPNCLKATTWTTFARQPDPSAPFRLTAYDKRILTALRIQSDDA